MKAVTPTHKTGLITGPLPTTAGVAGTSDDKDQLKFFLLESSGLKYVHYRHTYILNTEKNRLLYTRNYSLSRRSM